MMTNSRYLHATGIRSTRLAAAVAFIVLFLSIVSAQTFQLQDRHYRQENGRWYTYFTGKLGDEVRPERLVVQLRAGITIDDLALTRRGLGDLQIIAGPFAENF